MAGWVEGLRGDPSFFFWGGEIHWEKPSYMVDLPQRASTFQYLVLGVSLKLFGACSPQRPMDEKADAGEHERPQGVISTSRF